MTEPDTPSVLQTVTAKLNEAPTPITDVVQLLPRAAGLYAWWAEPEVLPGLPGPANDACPHVRLLYVGIASNLRNRIARNHLARSGSSTLRRTLAGLLLPTQRYRTTWTDRVVLIADDERRLTTWMRDHLRLTWFACPQPRQHESTLIRLLQPPLNVDGAEQGEARRGVKAAKAAYTASAGPRPAHV